MSGTEAGRRAAKGVHDLAGWLRLFTYAHVQFLALYVGYQTDAAASVRAHCFLRGHDGWQTMRADEYIRLQAACVAMARQCQGLDEQARWAKLADAAFVAAHAGLAMARNRGAGREPERKIPCSYPSALFRPNSAAAADNIPLTTKSPVERQLAGPSLMITS